MKNEKGFVAYHVLDSVADDLLLDALLPEDKGGVVMSPKKERPRRFFAFIQSGWGVAIVCALVAVSVMVGILWAGNRPGPVTPPAGTAEPESDPVTQEILTDESQESPAETSEPVTVFVPTEITRSCTLRTDGSRYEWGGNNVYATLTSTEAGAILDIGDESWQLRNLETGEYVPVAWAVVDYGVTTNANGDRSLIIPKSSTAFAKYQNVLRFDWENTPPGRYRLTYTGVELAEGEEYPYYDFEIYESPLQSDVHTLTFLYCSDTFLRDDYFVEEQHNGGGLSSAIYEREMMVEQAMDLELLCHDGGDFLNYGDELKTSVLSGDDTYAVVMTHNVYGMTDLMTASILTDLAEMNERQEIHLNSDYWDKAMMEDVSLGGHMYVGYNDFLLPNHHMVVFNRSMYAPYVDMEGNLYDHVRAGDWTLEKMADVAALVSGQNADGEIVYGFGSNGGQQLFAFVPAGGVKVVDKRDDGIPYVAGVADTHDRWASLIEWVYDLCNADNAYDWQENLVSPGQNYNILSSGRVLLSLASTSEYRTLQGRATTYGVLPYPKYDEAQTDYHTLYYGGMLGVTTAVRDTAVVGRTLDLLARHAQPVHTAFAETVLGTSAENAPDDIQMLEIMEDTLTSDLIYVAYDDNYGNHPLFNCMFLRLNAWNKEQTAEAMQSAAKQYDRYLEKIHEKVADE